MKSNVPTNGRTRLVGLKLAARELGIPYSTFYGCTLKGELPHIRIGRAIYLEREAVETWLKAHRETAA